MSPSEFFLLLLAVAAASAVPTWAWWAVADADGPDMQPDARLVSAIAAAKRAPLLAG